MNLKSIPGKKETYKKYFPSSGNWRAAVEGNSTPIYRANGYMQAVFVGAGQHDVEFRYWSPAAFMGMLISCLTFLAAEVYFAVLGMKILLLY
jgi:uncharacterized membrane protein YfhO